MLGCFPLKVIVGETGIGKDTVYSIVEINTIPIRVSLTVRLLWLCGGNVKGLTS